MVLWIWAAGLFADFSATGGRHAVFLLLAPALVGTQLGVRQISVWHHCIGLIQRSAGWWGDGGIGGSGLG